MPEKILRTEYSEEMQKSYLDYSMSVITSRAIPDARDGLKPVQRRVLYDMNELHLDHDKPHRKSARIVGDTMGKYHPHGDSSIYDTLVVMSQGFKRGMPLVDGHGNFGSIEGDGAAAMRYTEAKLEKFAQDVYLRDLDKTVRFVPNYDETEKEPEVLPVRLPNLLINGAEGIAVGMSTSIPPHNLGEVCDACTAFIQNNDISTEELMGILKGPDFPTGGIIANKSELLSIYETGVGKIKLRGKIEVELGRRKSDRDKLIISEIPYTMIGSGIDRFLMDVANLVETKKLTDVVDISNQSNKEGMRIVLELKKDADIEKIKNILYKKTKLEDTYGVNMLAIADGRPETMNLRSILRTYLDFQYENATHKYTILLEKESERSEVQEGLIEACDCIDVIIAILRGAKSLADAKACLTSGDVSKITFKNPSFKKDAMQLHFTERQAQAILDMRLYRLIGLEIDALKAEHAKTLKRIKEYQRILKSHKNMDEVFLKDIEAIKKEYAFARKSVLMDCEEAVYVEAPIAEEEIVFVMDRFGYCKTMDRTLYERNQQTVDTENKEVFYMMNTDKICIFTDSGVMHSVKALDVPNGKTKDKGTPIDNISKFDGSKEAVLYVSSSKDMVGRLLFFATKMGLVKQVPCSEFESQNKTIVATKLADGDRVAAVLDINDATSDVVLRTRENYMIRFAVAEAPEMKKVSKGVKGIQLTKDDEVIEAYMICDTEKIDFHGRKMDITKLKQVGRAGKGSKVRA